MSDYEYVMRVFSEPNAVKNAFAATKLRNLGASGRELLPTVFGLCRDIDLSGDIDKRDYTFLLAAARSIACVICDSGFKSSDALHQDFLDWTLRLSHHGDNELCATATWSLGDLGIPPEDVRTRLTELLHSSRRKADHELVTCRSIAFRMLARVDQRAASNFVRSEACKEYLASVDHWLKELSDNVERREELRAEVAWLHNNEHR